MIEDSPYERLIAINGHDLSGAKQQEEQKKGRTEEYEKAVSERQRESTGQRSRRLAKYQAERKRDQLMLDR
jgi:hypothetical protein